MAGSPAAGVPLAAAIAQARLHSDRLLLESLGLTPAHELDPTRTFQLHAPDRIAWLHWLGFLSAAADDK